MAEPGDGAEFARIALPHLDAAYTLARWLMRDRTAAEDVVQDAYVRALTYFSSFRGGDARAWVLRIVRNTAYARLSAGRAGADVPLDEAIEDTLADPADDPEAMVARIEGMALLSDALAALPVELREVIVLRELEEMSYRDIAAVAGVPVGTVMSRLWRARQALMRVGAKEAV
jgi:RNA polymerase sigma-70 factor (ECF subfamily)